MASTAERVPARSLQDVEHTRRFTAVALVLTVVAVVVTATSIVAADAISTGVVSHAGLALAWALATGVVGIKRPAEPLSVTVGFGAVAVAVVGTGGAMAAADAADAGMAIRSVALGLLPAIGIAFLAGLPDGRLRPAIWTTVGIFAAAGAGLGALASLADVAEVWPAIILGVFATPFAVTWSVGRYRRAHGVVRQRMQWVGLAVTIGATVAAVSGALHLLVSWPDDIAIVSLVAGLPLPLVLMAGISSRLVARVDRLLGYTVSAAGLAGLVAAVYVIVVLGLGRVPSEDERTLLALSMAAAAVAAVLFPTTRARLQHLATRVVYGEQHAPDEVLRTFGSRLTRSVPMDELLLQAAESLRKTFGLDVVEIWTGQAGRLERTVSLPERGRARLTIGAKELPVMARAGIAGPAWLKVWLPDLLIGREDSMVRVAPVAHQGEVLGAILVERKASVDVFSDEEERVLSDLARTVGVALHNVQLDSALQETLDEVRRQAEDLRRSRERVVKSADAARRKLERDLHDGAQQHIVALAVKARLIRTLLDSDVDTAKAMLEELGDDVQEAVQQLRAFSHGIYPPVLVDRGLGPALESVAMRAALPTQVDADGLGRYPQEIEAAVYFCCLEALQNAGKHAGEGATVHIRVHEDEGVLLFEVADDGAGFEVGDEGLGAGFVNMQDRVGAAGGSLEVTSEPARGTTVAGRIPVA